MYMDEISRNIAEEEIDGFSCPITCELMTEPVVLICNGQTYEKSAIQEWFRRGHRTDPITNQPLISTNIVPNYSLRRAIESFLQSYPELCNQGNDQASLEAIIEIQEQKLRDLKLKQEGKISGFDGKPALHPDFMQVLEEINCRRHIGKFCQEHIFDISDVLLLQREDLRELGLSIGETNRMLDRIKDLKCDRDDPPPGARKSSYDIAFEKRKKIHDKRDPGARKSSYDIGLDIDGLERIDRFRQKRKPEVRERRMSRARVRRKKMDDNFRRKEVDMGFDLQSQDQFLDALDQNRELKRKHRRRKKMHGDYKRYKERFRRQRDDMDEVIDQFIERQPPDRMAKRIEKSIRRFSVPVNYMHARKQERPRRDSDLNRARESRRRNLRQPRERRIKTQMQVSEPLSPLSDAVRPPPFDFKLLEANSESNTV